MRSAILIALLFLIKSSNQLELEYSDKFILVFFFVIFLLMDLSEWAKNLTKK